MSGKLIKRVTSCFLAGMLVFGEVSPAAGFASEQYPDDGIVIELGGLPDASAAAGSAEGNLIAEYGAGNQMTVSAADDPTEDSETGDLAIVSAAGDLTPDGSAADPGFSGSAGLSYEGELSDGEELTETEADFPVDEDGSLSLRADLPEDAISETQESKPMAAERGQDEMSAEEGEHSFVTGLLVDENSDTEVLQPEGIELTEDEDSGTEGLQPSGADLQAEGNSETKDSKPSGVQAQADGVFETESSELSDKQTQSDGVFETEATESSGAQMQGNGISETAATESSDAQTQKNEISETEASQSSETEDLENTDPGLDEEPLTEQVGFDFDETETETESEMPFTLQAQEEGTALTSLDQLTGSGLEEDPYRITSKEEFALISTISQSQKLIGWFVLDQDIELTDLVLPVGPSADYAFNGTFDGQGHTISGGLITDGSGCTGLFGYVTGTIRNLEVSAEYAGSGLIGVLAGYSSGVIDNCSVSGSVNSSNHHGGLVGENRGTIRDCLSEAVITGSSNAGSSPCCIRPGRRHCWIPL